MITENDELYARASFGQSVDAFWNSQIGSYLRTRAEEHYSEALAELKTCDATDSRRVLRLQGEVWMAESFHDWLSEVILDGIKSLDLIEHPDQESE